MAPLLHITNPKRNSVGIDVAALVAGADSTNVDFFRHCGQRSAALAATTARWQPVQYMSKQ
jgi:hypothetical protein